MNPQKPLAYGYMRIFCDVTEQQVFAMEHRMKEFAEELGFQLVTMYQEVVNGSIEEFCEMCKELEQADVHDVIVPSLRHFSPHERLQGGMVERLLFTLDTTVHALNEHHSEKTSQDG